MAYLTKRIDGGSDFNSINKYKRENLRWELRQLGRRQEIAIEPGVIVDNRLSREAKMITNVVTIKKTRNNKTSDFAVVQKVGTIDIVKQRGNSYGIREREAST